jgi:phage-related protein
LKKSATKRTPEDVESMKTIFGGFGNIFGEFGNIFGEFGNIFGEFGNIFGEFGNIFGEFGKEIFGEVKLRPVWKTFIPLTLSESFTGAANSLREF